MLSAETGRQVALLESLGHTRNHFLESRPAMSLFPSRRRSLGGAAAGCLVVALCLGTPVARNGRSGGMTCATRCAARATPTTPPIGLKTYAAPSDSTPMAGVDERARQIERNLGRPLNCLYRRHRRPARSSSHSPRFQRDAFYHFSSHGKICATGDLSSKVAWGWLAFAVGWLVGQSPAARFGWSFSGRGDRLRGQLPLLLALVAMSHSRVGLVRPACSKLRAEMIVPLFEGCGFWNSP